MESEELRKYIRPSKSYLIIAVVVTVAVLAYVVVSLVSPTTKFNLAPLIVGGIISAIFYYVGISLGKDYRRLFSEHSKQEMDDICTEFSSAKPWFSDRIRAGETMIFMKKDPKLTPYGEIVNVHEFVHKTNGVEDRRALRVKMKDGTVSDLCQILPRGKSADEVMRFYMFLHEKNPSTTFGYKK